MNVTLTPYWQQFIRDRVESGEYADASEVRHAALRMLEYKERVLEFRNYVKDALDPANADKLVDADHGFAQERMQRIIDGERPVGPAPWYVLPAVYNMRNGHA